MSHQNQNSCTLRRARTESSRTLEWVEVGVEIHCTEQGQHLSSKTWYYPVKNKSWSTRLNRSGLASKSGGPIKSQWRRSLCDTISVELMSFKICNCPLSNEDGNVKDIVCDGWTFILLSPSVIDSCVLKRTRQGVFHVRPASTNWNYRIHSFLSHRLWIDLPQQLPTRSIKNTQPKPTIELGQRRRIRD